MIFCFHPSVSNSRTTAREWRAPKAGHKPASGHTPHSEPNRSAWLHSNPWMIRTEERLQSGTPSPHCEAGASLVFAGSRGKRLIGRQPAIEFSWLFEL